MRRAVAFVLKGYPRLSETFIANEIQGLESLGLDIRIISLRHPTDREVHPVHREIRAPVNYLPEYLRDEPGRVWRGWRGVRRRAGYRRALRCWIRDLCRDPTPNRVRRFGQALVLASELPVDVGRLHAHFLHTPSSVARYAATILGLPWSASAHAKDIWTTPDWEVSEKLGDCDWLTTCSEAAHRRLTTLAPDPGKVELNYHGIDPARFPGTAGTRAARDGSDPADPVRLLAVGRAVEKKGFDVLIDALAMLPPGLNWRLVHAGGGPLLRSLRDHAETRGIADRMEWRGPLVQDELLACYRAADVFVLPSRIARNGDRDGLPNVLLEAQSQGVPCIATRVSAIPELIVDGTTGMLTEADEPRALADALATLIRDPARRARLGDKGAERVRSEFAFDDCIDRISRRFGLATRAESDHQCASPSTLP